MAGLLKILQALGAAQQGRCPAGEDTLHHLRIAAEGGGALGSVQDTQPSGCARSQIKKPASLPQPFSDAVNGRTDLGAHGLNRLLRATVLGDKQVDQLAGRQLVKVTAEAVALLGEQKPTVIRRLQVTEELSHGSERPSSR